MPARPIQKLRRSLAKRRDRVVARLARARETAAHGRALRTMDAIASRRPVFVSVETVTLCNARCVFCAYPKSDREKQIMTMELFAKICREYAALGGGFLSLNAVISDPLVDPLLFERIRLVKRDFPNITLALFTNGIRFAAFSDTELLEVLSAIAVLDLSLGGLEEADYAKMYGVAKFKEVWSSLLRIADLARAHGLNLRRTLHFRSWDAGRIVRHEKYRQLQALGYDCHDVLTTYSNWDGMVSAADLPEGATISDQDNSNVSQPCGNPSLELTVTPNGDALACGCMDGKLSHVVGNAARQTLDEIWLGPELEAFRASFTNGKICDMCRGCKMYWPRDATFSNPRLQGYEPRQDYFRVLFGR